MFSIKKSIAAVEQELLSYGLVGHTVGPIADYRKKYEKTLIYTESGMSITYDGTRFFEIEFILDILEKNENSTMG